MMKLMGEHSIPFSKNWYCGHAQLDPSVGMCKLVGNEDVTLDNRVQDFPGRCSQDLARSCGLA